jgi:hypothetical protein
VNDAWLDGRLREDRLDCVGEPADGVGRAADQVAADLHAVDLLEMHGDLPRGEPATVEREDLLVEPHKAKLAHLRTIFGSKLPSRSRGLDVDGCMLGDQRLTRTAVARVPGRARRLAVQLVDRLVADPCVRRYTESLPDTAVTPARPTAPSTGSRRRVRRPGKSAMTCSPTA